MTNMAVLVSQHGVPKAIKIIVNTVLLGEKKLSQEFWKLHPR